MKQSEIGKYIRSTKDYYNAMIGHGYILPSYGCALVTRDYLDGVRKGWYYCPTKDDHIPHLEVANPPPKEELLKIWKKAVKIKVEKEPINDAKWNRILCTMKLIEYEGKLPDNDWLLVCLADVPGPDCEVFKKNYRYEKPPSILARPEIHFYNEDGLFDGLNELNPS